MMMGRTKTGFRTVLINGVLCVKDDTLTNAKAAIIGLFRLRHSARKCGAHSIEIYVDSYDAPYLEIVAWLNRHGAVENWSDGRFHRYLMSVL